MSRLLTVLFVFLLALATWAGAASAKKQRTQHSAAQVPPVTQPEQQPTIYGPWGLQIRDKARFGDPAYQVYRMNGDYAGADPDPLVRSMLRRDDPNGDR